jgi:hypothetical protein
MLRLPVGFTTGEDFKVAVTDPRGWRSKNYTSIDRPDSDVKSEPRFLHIQIDTVPINEAVVE